MKIPMQMGGAVDVTSEVFGTLPNGLSVAYANLHKASLSGNVLTLTFAISRTSSYTDGSSFDYIKEGYRPHQRVYVSAVNSVHNSTYSAYASIQDNGKMLLSFGNTSAAEFYATITYTI